MDPIKNLEEKIKEEKINKNVLDKNIFNAKNINEELEMLVRTDEEFARFKGYID